ncbi:hypothetical protein BHM03_00051373, partial [Ensete ventricosum]
DAIALSLPPSAPPSPLPLRRRQGWPWVATPCGLVAGGHPPCKRVAGGSPLQVGRWRPPLACVTLQLDPLRAPHCERLPPLRARCARRRYPCGLLPLWEVAPCELALAVAWSWVAGRPSSSSPPLRKRSKNA